MSVHETRQHRILLFESFQFGRKTTAAVYQGYVSDTQSDVSIGQQAENFHS